jgi:SAM-dependent methyltransferase
METGAMRRKTSIDPAYFEQLYAADSDPWQFETSDYERAKYDRTLAALPQPRFRNALEIGCANGVLTARLAEHCEKLIAVDVVDSAIEAARKRCTGASGVTIRKARIPSQRIDGPFDLILVSEVAYYWDDDDLAAAAAYFCEALADGGYLMLVHWTGETDYPKSADEAVDALRQYTGDRFTEIRRERHDKYRLDLWRKM